jgi:hypothetical protein
VQGFGGTPATVGTNQGNGIDFSQIGRYDTAGAGPTGIDSLDNQVFCFSTNSDANVPPLVGNVPSGNQIDLECDESLIDYVLTFAAPENYQTVDLVVSGESFGLVVTVGDGIQTALATLNWTPTLTVPAQVQLTFNATDSEGGNTVVVVTVTSRAPCCTNCDFSSLFVYPNSAVDGKVLDGTSNGYGLLNSCGLTVVPFNTDSYITVLGSESPVRNTKNPDFDPDLGSPSRSCGGFGRGKGGMLGEPWENCEPLGNVLILQDPSFTYPNDDADGGCLNFTFPYHVTNLKLGLLDIDSENVTIDVCPQCSTAVVSLLFT